MNFFSTLSQLRSNDSSSAGTSAETDESKKSLDDITANPGPGVLLKTITAGDITNYPRKGDKCTIHYEAYTEEGMYNSGDNPTPFDSSRKRGKVFSFRLGEQQVIEGLDVAVSKMSLGEEVEATIPFPYAYGVAGYPPVVPPRATLIFRVELIQFSSSGS